MSEFSASIALVSKESRNLHDLAAHNVGIRVLSLAGSLTVDSAATSTRDTPYCCYKRQTVRSHDVGCIQLSIRIENRLSSILA